MVEEVVGGAMGTLVRALAVADFGVVDGVGREDVVEPLLARLRREERMPRVRPVHVLRVCTYVRVRPIRYC
jgi:hypothetical protein